MKQKNPFDALYAGIEEVKDRRGKVRDTVLYNSRGDYSVIIQMENPVLQYCASAEPYVAFHSLFCNIIKTFGEGICIQKQDIFCRQCFHAHAEAGSSFLSRSYFRHFDGRRYNDIRTYLIITRRLPKGFSIKWSQADFDDFLLKVGKLCELLKNNRIPYHKLGVEEVSDYCHRFLAQQFRHGPYALSNLNVAPDCIHRGGSDTKVISLIDVDRIDLPLNLSPLAEQNIGGDRVPVDVMSFLPNIPNADCVIYNQVIQIPPQRQRVLRLTSKATRHNALPDPSNRIAAADIDVCLTRVSTEGAMLVDTHFDIIVSCPHEAMAETVSYVESRLFEIGVMPSTSAYNQKELFIAAFPGNGYLLNPKYDLCLCLHDSISCLVYKERLEQDEESPVRHWFTDRQGLPVCIDLTGKSGKVRYTTNSNFMIFGPSGTGKSFATNSPRRKYTINRRKKGYIMR